VHSIFVVADMQCALEFAKILLRKKKTQTTWHIAIASNEFFSLHIRHILEPARAREETLQSFCLCYDTVGEAPPIDIQSYDRAAVAYVGDWNPGTIVAVKEQVQRYRTGQGEYPMLLIGVTSKEQAGLMIPIFKTVAGMPVYFIAHDEQQEDAVIDGAGALVMTPIRRIFLEMGGQSSTTPD